MNKRDIRRDSKSGAILNTNRAAYEEYKAKTLKEKQLEERLVRVENKMDKLLNILEKLRM